MTIPFDLAERGSAHTGLAVRAFAGRILDAPSISASDFARVPTAYNAEGLIVAARDATTAGAVGSALRDVLAEFSQQHPEIQVETSYGSSGNFFAQLSNQANPELRRPGWHEIRHS